MHTFGHYFDRMKKRCAFLFSLLLLLAGSCIYPVNAHEFNIRVYDSLQRKLKSSALKDTTRVNIYLKIAHEFQTKDTHQLVLYGKQALALSEKIRWNSGLIKSNLLLGRCYDDNKNLTMALQYYRQCPKNPETNVDSANIGELYNLLGNVFLQTNRLDSSLLYYKTCMVFLTDPRSRLSMLANIGQLCTRIGDFSGALESYLRSLKINERILSGKNTDQNDSIMHAGLLVSIGDVYIEMSQYAEAKANYYNVLALNTRLKNSTLEFCALNGIALTHTKKGEYQKATEFYEKALIVSKQNEDHVNEAYVLSNLGDAYLSLGNLEKAFFYTSTSLKLSEAHHYGTILSKVYITLGKINEEKKIYSAAVRYLQKAIDNSKEIGADAELRDAWQALSRVYEKTNQPSAALDAYKHFYTLRDSIYNVDKARQMTSADMQYRFDTKQLADSLQSSAFKLKIQRQRIYIFSGFTGLALMLLLSFFIYRSYSRTKKMNVIISKANETINDEKQVSENLLLNILPKNVADELKANGKVKAKMFDNVSVLFTDFVNFTQIAERHSPEELVEELDTCFKAFDDITSKYNVEKVKTIGDAYMAISGLPLANPRHASDILNAAIEMRDFMINRRATLGDVSFEMRLGIHSGKVVAGIVGMKKFAYDVWGDTVNTAARMEQSSHVGKINISHHTWELVKDQFICTDRGEIDAKNKGKMRMYFVESVRADS